MKKYITILCLCILLCCGCSRLPESYSFPNRLESITSVELLHNMNPGGRGYDECNMVLLHSVNEAEIKAFIDALSALPTKKVGTPTPGGYGRYVTKVTYENGDVEIYGPINIEYIQLGTQQTGIGDYRFVSLDDYILLFSQYAGVDLDKLPDPPPTD